MNSIAKRINPRNFLTAAALVAGGALLLRQIKGQLHPTRHDSEETALQTSGRTIHWASLYDPLVKLITLGKDQRVREATAELAQIQPGESILDVGCGTGHLTRVAKVKAGAAAEVAGLDASPEMIDVARQKAIEEGVDIDFQTGLIEQLPYDDEQFDLVLSSLMVHHLPDDLKAAGFAEVYRVLKPGGRLLVVDFEPPKHPLIRRFLIVLLGHTMMMLDVRQYAPLLETIGFAEVQTGPTSWRWLSFARGQKIDGEPESEE